MAFAAFLWTVFRLLSLPLLLFDRLTTVEASFLVIPSADQHQTNRYYSALGNIKNEGTAINYQRQRRKGSLLLSPATTGSRFSTEHTASIWFYNDEQDDFLSQEEWYEHHEQRGHAKSSIQRSVQETWRWCTNFVVPLNLCPWAVSSVTTPGAVQLYIVPTSSSCSKHPLLTPRKLEALVETVAHRFTETTCPKNQTAVDMSRVAIAFLVLEGSSKQEEETKETSNEAWFQSFPEFYDWFTYLEDSWIDQGDEIATDKVDDDNIKNIYNLVTLAAFHPEWEFGGGTSSLAALNFEKKSPYPTISMVWTAGIDAAGPEATERIGTHNEQLLQEDMILSELQQLYEDAVLMKEDGMEADPT